MAVSATRELVRTLLGYASSLPIDEFRSLERILDGIAGEVLPPFVALQGVASEVDEIGAVPGVRKLRVAGVPHVASEVEGMFHVFPFLLPWTRESRDVYEQAGEFVRDIFGQRRNPPEPSRDEIAPRHA